MGKLRGVTSLGLVVLVLLTYSSMMPMGQAAASSSDPWAKTYSGPGIDLANSVQQTSDGGFIVAGYTAASGVGEGAWVLRLTAKGGVVWQKIYVEGPFPSANSIAQTSDGGFIVAGATDCASARPAFEGVWVFKLNADGSLSWQNCYGGGIASSVQEISGGGFIVAGSTTTSVFPTGAHALVLRLDASGGVVWEKTYGGTGTDSANSVKQTSDGGFIIAGSTSSFGAGGSDAWILKLNSDGSVAWQKTYGGTGTDNFLSVQPTSDGGFIAAGSTSSFGAGAAKAWILKLNSDGTVAWQNTYGGTGTDEASSVQETSGGGFIVAGSTTSFGAGGSDDLVLRLDASGGVVWEKTYGGTGTDSANSVKQTSDGGFIIAGSTNSFGAGSNCSGIPCSHAWVLKLDANGFAGRDCRTDMIMQTPAARVMSSVATVAISSATVSSVGAVTSTSAKVGFTTATTGVQCRSHR